MPCRVLIADDHAIVRSALRQLLEGIAGAEVVGEAEDGLGAIALAKKLKPDLVLLDVAMPHGGGFTVLGEIGRWSPATRVAVVTGVTARGTLAELQRCGAVGVLLKTSSPAELDRGLRRLVAGGSYVSIELRDADRGSPIGALTMREQQVLSLVAQGRSNTEIATVLAISAKTVDNHRTNLMRKLNVHSAVELAALAVREELI